MPTTYSASTTIAEMREFASFTPDEQRYIKRSLDIGLARGDAFKLWGRGERDCIAIRRQYVAYRDVIALRELVPSSNAPSEIESFMGSAVRMAAFDLGQEQIGSFSAFRFLYERLIGAKVRNYLPSVFCAASALPQIEPEQRKVLLQSLSEAAAMAAGWSDRAPSFFPEYVEDVEAV